MGIFSNKIRGVIVDLEMTGLTKRDKIISLGAVDSLTDKVFYAESIDWSIDDIGEDNKGWIQEHVINNLVFPDILHRLCKANDLVNTDLYNIFDNSLSIITRDTGNGCMLISQNSIVVLGDEKYIKDKFDDWLQYVKAIDEQIVFIMDVGQYDFVFLADLFGGAMKLPMYISPTYFEANMSIAELNDCLINDAFDVSRMGMLPDEGLFLEDIKQTYPILQRTNQHNSLVDSLVLKQILQE